jgi:hypothetical protein
VHATHIVSSGCFHHPKHHHHHHPHHHQPNQQPTQPGTPRTHTHAHTHTHTHTHTHKYCNSCVKTPILAAAAASTVGRCVKFTPRRSHSVAARPVLLTLKSHTCGMFFGVQQHHQQQQQQGCVFGGTRACATCCCCCCCWIPLHPSLPVPTPPLPNHFPPLPTPLAIRTSPSTAQHSMGCSNKQQSSGRDLKGHTPLYTAHRTCLCTAQLPAFHPAGKPRRCPTISGP